MRITGVVVVVDPLGTVVEVVVVDSVGREVDVVVEASGSVVVGDAVAEGEFCSGLKANVTNVSAVAAATDRQRDQEGFTRSM